MTEEPVQVVDATVDGTAVQSYKFGHNPTTVDYECQALSSGHRRPVPTAIPDQE